jgi:hypothetical protein
MDEQHARKVDEAARRFAEAVAESYRAVSDRSVSVQQLNAELTQKFYEDVLSSLRDQTQSNRRTSQRLADQTRRGQGAAQELARESASAYLDFLNSMYSYYRQQSEATATPATETTPAGSIESQPAEATGDVEADGNLPIEDYDSLNVRQVSERLVGLSVEEIKRLRDYEIRNKNRRSLVSRMDNKIETAAS